jgi:hypothetical protein
MKTIPKNCNIRNPLNITRYVSNPRGEMLNATIEYARYASKFSRKKTGIVIIVIISIFLGP